MGELYHHGVKGMHWGVRRYQNPDGSRIKGTSKFNTALDRADRAHKEADQAKKLANKYTSAMDAKVQKRSGDRAFRASQEAKTAKKLADKYTSAMDKKAQKRTDKLDAIYEKDRNKIDKINNKSEMKKLKSEMKKLHKNSFLDSKRMTDQELRDATNRINLERNYRQVTKSQYVDTMSYGRRYAQSVADRATQTSVMSLSDPIIQGTIGEGSRHVAKTLVRKATLKV